MGAINPKDLAKYTGELFVTNLVDGVKTRLSSVRGLKSELDNSNVIEVKADDTGTVLKVIDLKANIVLSCLEVMGRDTLALLFNGTSTDTAGIVVPGQEDTAISGVWKYNSAIELNKSNGDGTKVTVNSVVAGTDGALVEDTDYFVGLVNGKTTITIIDSATLTTEAQDIVINYDYTPNASEDITIDIDSVEARNFEVTIEAEDPADAGKMRITILTSATFEGIYGMSYADVVEAGDIEGAEMTFSANKGSQFVYKNEIL